MKAQRHSPNYTTNWNELPVAKAYNLALVGHTNAIHHYTFGAFDLLMDFFDCFAAIKPGATLTLEAVEQAIAAKR